jgi:cytochrome c2
MVSFKEVDGDHHIAVRAPERVGPFLHALLDRPSGEARP